MPGVPHHITQRGNRRMETFFCDEDYEEYLALMAAEALCRDAGEGPGPGPAAPQTRPEAEADGVISMMSPNPRSL